MNHGELARCKVRDPEARCALDQEAVIELTAVRWREKGHYLPPDYANPDAQPTSEKDWIAVTSHRTV